MNRLLGSLLLLLGAALVAAPTAVAQDKPAAQPAGQPQLELADLYPRRSFWGKRARGMEWSHDDRFLGYLWNPYDDPGSDLWLYDAQSGQSRRVTSAEGMVEFDPDLKPIVERYKKEREEREKRKQLSEAERRRLEEEEEERRGREREDDEMEEMGERRGGRRGGGESATGPLRDYPGISRYVWARKSNELLFTYRGDLFRLRLSADGTPGKPERLTRTREPETGVRYANDDRGFFFQRGEGIFRARFDSPLIEQINPPLPGNLPLGQFRISPDETRMLILTSRNTGQQREVTYITYRDRFATARTVQRGVADDTFKTEAFVYLCDLRDRPDAPADEKKPWELWKWPPPGSQGEEFGQVSLAEEPFSPDSRRVVFATWARTQRKLEVVVADVEPKNRRVVFTDTHSGEHQTPVLSRPFFSPDGTRIALMLEKSGYRHAWLIDPLVEGATQLTRGDFEVYPLRFSADGSSLYVRSSKELPSRMDLYSVSLADGAMTRLTRNDGTYGEPAIARDGKRVAMTFASWEHPGELCLLETSGGAGSGGEKPLTQSHAGTWSRVDRLRPNVFSFKNRHGHTVWGFMFLPPGHKQGEKRPLMIHVYGGPLGSTKQVQEGSFNTTGYLFNMYLAARMGYISATIDPRGTSGYGAVFGKANWEQVGKPQVEDLVDAVKFFEERYGVDRKKVGLNGWSFGGFQTQMALYTAPDVFTLGIAGAGPTEWQNYNTWYSGGVVGPSRPGKPEDLDKYSLTHLAKNLKGKLLLVHGVEDTNVLFQDTVKVYRALLRAGKGPLVELVIDPTGGHGLGGDIRTRQRFEIYLAFLEKHWGPYRPGEERRASTQPE